MVDDLDRRILTLLKANADQTVQQLATQLQVPKTTIHSRLSRLKENKTIQKIIAVVDHAQLGLTTSVLLTIHINQQVSRSTLADKLLLLEPISSVMLTANTTELIASADFETPLALSEFLSADKQGLAHWPEIASISTTLCTQTKTK